MIQFSKLLTWLDVRRIIRKKTNFGSRLPNGVVRIGCFSDALEIGIMEKGHEKDAKAALKLWFGDWFREEQSVIDLDVGEASLPVEFLPNEERTDTDIVVRPFWEEIAYVESNSEDEPAENVRLPEPYQPGSPQLAAFYSFKGGVGRTLMLSAFLFALFERAREIGRNTTVLVMDGDLEAPGLTYWSQLDKQRPTVSFIDFLELWHYPPVRKDEALSYIAGELKKSRKTFGPATLYFLPAFLDDSEMLDTPVLPENLARGSENTWACGDALCELGRALGADFVFIDLRAGLSEISSPIIFDPRIQRFIITTLAEQSVRGTKLVLEQVSHVAPPVSESDVENDIYHDPSIILSMLKHEFRSFPEFSEALFGFRSAYIESGEDNLYSKRLAIYETEFHEELLYVNSWDDARLKLSPTSMMKVAREWAKIRLEFIAPEESEPVEISGDTKRDDVRKLRDICMRYEYAENGEGDDLLVTEPLKNLAATFRDSLPRIVSIGAKGSGKTFNYIQISRFEYWEAFVDRVIGESVGAKRKTHIFPLLQSGKLVDKAQNIVDKARHSALEAGGSFAEFMPSECRKRIIAELGKETSGEVEWTNFWIRELAEAVGIDMDNSLPNPLGILNRELNRRELQVVFLFDGLEDIFEKIASVDTQQTALRALIDLPKSLSELRRPCLGIIIFLRRDFLRHAITQNLAQFENLYRSYDLSWDRDSFLRLVFWVCEQAEVIGARKSESERLSREEMVERLGQLWGMKLGPDKSREAYAVRWIFAALTDFKGRLQARDIVRFLRYAADFAVERPAEVVFDKWMETRLLPPQAIRRALEPCSREKVKETEEEYPEFKVWVNKITNELKPSERRIPFTPEQLAMDQATATTLEEMGVIYEDRGKDETSRYYIPEIFRTGLEFSLDKGARPRVLVLKRKALGTGSF